MKQHQHQFICAICNAPPKFRHELIKALPDDTLKTICEICNNILVGNIKPSSSQLHKLRKYKKVIRQLGYKPYYPMKYKRKIISNQRGSGFFLSVLPIIASLLGGFISSRLRKK